MTTPTPTPAPKRKFCGPCAEYFTERGPRIAKEIVVRCTTNGKSPTDEASRYRAGVHARHVAGLPLTFPRSMPSVGDL